MSDEKEAKLSEDELKQVAGGKPPAVKVVVKPTRPIGPWPTIDGLKGESTDSEHKD
jgi:hypothetical protein